MHKALATDEAPTSQPERSKQLRRVANTLASVIPSLNTRSDVCNLCGLRNDENFTEAQAAKKLKQMVKELRQLAYLFETGKSLLELRQKRATSREEAT